MHSEYIRKAEPLGFALRLTLGVDPGYRLTLVTLQVTRTEPEPPRPPPPEDGAAVHSRRGASAGRSVFEKRSGLHSARDACEMLARHSRRDVQLALGCRHQAFRLEMYM